MPHQFNNYSSKGGKKRHDYINMQIDFMKHFNSLNMKSVNIYCRIEEILHMQSTELHKYLRNYHNMR
jgi:hypothetical protein